MNRVRIIFILLPLFLININAQESLKHEKKVYEAENGSLYINKALPIYFKIATSPDPNGKDYLLQSTETPKYANPMYFDTEGYNTFRSPSAVDTITKQIVYPLRDVIYEVYADSKAPVTRISYGKTKPFSKEGKHYVNGKASISFKASDQTSGVENILVSIDGVPFKPYTDTIEITEEKEYKIKYYAVDNVGNAENVHEVIIVLDKTEPKTNLEIEGDKHEDILSGRSKIKLIAEDAGIGTNKIYYQIDEGGYKTYTAPISAAYISQGEHTITYYATDNVGNEESPKEYKFYVDKTPPTIVEEIIGTSFMANGKEFTSGRTQLKLVTFDNKAGVKEVYYSINGEDYELYTKPFYLSMTSGNLAVKTYALDYVNNKSTSQEQSSRAKIPYIDLSGPSLKYQFNGPMFTTTDTIFINKTTKIVLGGSDAEAGLSKIDYRVNDDKTKTYEEPFSLNKEGYYKVFFEGADNVDNTNNKEFNVFVDNEGPEIYASFSIASKGKERVEGKNLEVYPSHVVVFLSATDEKVGVEKIYYKINDGAEKPYAGLISGLKPGKYEIELRAVDKLGNNKTDKIRFAVVR